MGKLFVCVVLMPKTCAIQLGFAKFYRDVFSPTEQSKTITKMIDINIAEMFLQLSERRMRSWSTSITLALCSMVTLASL
jgi:hypothetical protein